MPSSFTQDHRIARLTTPLGKDALVLHRFDAVEGVNELFDIRLEAVTEDRVASFSSCIGQICNVSFKTIGDEKRHFNGILAYVQELGIRNTSFVYRLVLRPWLHYLSIKKRSRIFHNKSVVDVLREVLQGGEVSWSLRKNYAPVEYCVQYRESDLAFATRLMEQYGILYYFRHQEGSHALVLIDELSAADPIPGDSREYISISRQHRREVEHLYHWMPERRLTASKVTVDSYDFKKPSTDLTAEKSEKNDYGPLEIVDYPGNYVDKTLGETFAKVRLDMERGADGHYLAAGDCVSCFPGSLMKLSGHPDQAQNTEYLALRSTHTFTAEEYRSSDAVSADDAYHGNYEFIRSDRSYAPPIVTEKPFMHGPQTAKVVGKAGSEIDVDEFGRIEVLFHWDRANAKSRRVRLAQVWAGKGWGGIYIPRIGMEVIVDFLDGDPDQPIVVGTVYNAENMPPFALPGQKNQAGWKSSSTPGGGGYNEIVMDDTKGKEQFRVQAEYNMDTLVKHDETRKIKNNRDTKIDGNETVFIKGYDDQHIVKYLHITADQEIVLTSGASKISMKADGTIDITGVNVTVKGSASLTTEAMKASHTGSVAMVIKGGIVKIN